MNITSVAERGQDILAQAKGRRPARMPRIARAHVELQIGDWCSCRLQQRQHLGLGIERVEIEALGGVPAARLLVPGQQDTDRRPLGIGQITAAEFEQANAGRAAIGIALIGSRVLPFLAGLPAVFAIAFAARFLAGNGLFIDWGLEYVIFALGLGLLISNSIGTPEWLKPAVQTEFFVKTGLVILGASLIFSEVLQAGALGITQAVLVVFVVWYSCFWLARKLKVDDEFAAMLSTAVSICGVSAAIAACGAIKGDKKKLSYVTSLVLIVAVPMMIAMPWIAKSTGMDDLVAGAWLGGTLDTSASVVAAGALISDAAMKTGVIVKFSQNALIGVAAFALAIWWALRQGAETGEKPSAAVIWERFPKFVIGFVLASAVFSFLLPPEIVSGTRSALNDIRTWWFALAFVCVGLETRFVDLLTTDRGRPALAFVGAQTINVFWTLLLAWLLFGGVIFAQPAIQ